MDQAHDFDSVLGSREVHSQGHFQHHLLLPEISFTATTGPLRCRDTADSQPLSWPCPKHSLLSLWAPHFSFSLPSAMPSRMSLLWSKAFVHTRSWELG